MYLDLWSGHTAAQHMICNLHSRHIAILCRTIEVYVIPLDYLSLSGHEASRYGPS